MQQSPLKQPETADSAEDNPALSNVIERNIRTIIRLRLKAASARSVQVRSADAITAFSGRMLFVYVHIAWFGVWILLNTGRFGAPAFDWQVGSSATLGTSTRFFGNILADASITLNTGATLMGRALALHGGVTMNTTGSPAPITNTPLVNLTYLPLTVR